MKKIFLFTLIFFLGAGSAHTQDSVYVRITKAKIKQGVQRYWMKEIKTGTKYYTECRCKTERREDEVIAVDRKDLQTKFITY